MKKICLLIIGILLLINCCACNTSATDAATGESSVKSRFIVSFMNFDKAAIGDATVLDVPGVNSSIPSKTYATNGIRVMNENKFVDFMAKHDDILQCEWRTNEESDVSYSYIVVSCDSFNKANYIYVRNLYQSKDQSTLYIETGNKIEYFADAKKCSASKGSYLYFAIDETLLEGIKNVIVFTPQDRSMEIIEVHTPSESDNSTEVIINYDKQFME